MDAQPFPVIQNGRRDVIQHNGRSRRLKQNEKASSRKGFDSQNSGDRKHPDHQYRELSPGFIGHIRTAASAWSPLRNPFPAVLP